MNKNDHDLVRLHDITLALSLLTRVPVHVSNTDRAHRAAWAYPLIGVVPALLGLGLGGVMLWLGFTPVLAAVLCLITMVISTGAMHEDGLADTADGFWGGWTVERRLEIMQDSRIGTYGVIALVLSLLLRLIMLTLLFDAGFEMAVPALLSASVLSRGVLPVMMARLPHARRSGLSHQVGPVRNDTAILAALIACVFCIFVLGGQVVIAVLATVIAGAGMILLSRAKISGHTGDTLGAAQQIVEIAVVLTLLP